MIQELQKLAGELYDKLPIIREENEKKKQIKEIYNSLYKAYILGSNYCSNFVKNKDYKRIDEELSIKKL
jgi:hypothetical protein